MDEQYELDRGTREVIRRLEAYADARLDPSVAATTRMRAAVMAAAHRQAALVAADGAGALALASTQVTTSRAAPDESHGFEAWRRPVAAMLAGTLTLGILAGTALATRPGAPLYEARIWTEGANLPTTSLARVQAEVDRLQARIDEAEAAATAGDARGVVAAIDAYSLIVTEAAAGMQGDAAAGQVLQVTVTSHVAILTGLLDQVPPSAHDAVEHALLASTSVLEDIDDVTHGSSGGNAGSGNNGNGGNAGNPGNGTDGGGRDTGGGNANGGTGPGTGGGNGVGDPGAAGGGVGPRDGQGSEPTPKAPKPTPPGHERTPRPTNDHVPPGQVSAPTDPPSEDSQH
jgi:hypothetical protein